MRFRQNKDLFLPLCSCLLLSLCSFSASAPQGYNNYYNNNPYRRAAYSATSSYNPNSNNRYRSAAYSANSYDPNANRLRRPQSTSVRAQNSYATNYYSPTSYNPYPNYAKPVYAAATTAQRNALRDAYTTPKPPANSARDKNRVNKADSENAKFAGVSNQEAADDESTKTFSHFRRKRLRNRCFGLGRSAAAEATTPAPKEQGRFLWDVNVYNVYTGGRPGLFSDVQQSPLSSSLGCGGYGGGGGFGGLFGDSFGSGLGGGPGGGLGGGLLSDPIAAPYPVPPLNNFLSLFAPGILQNALAVTARPRPLPPPIQADPTASEVNDLQSDPAVDPNYGQPIIPQRPVPNRIYYDTPGAAPITPAQLVGGVATTVNGIIQQLTGNVQPVYPSVG